MSALFEVPEGGQSVKKQLYAQTEPLIRTRLLELQQQIRALEVPVVIVVGGVEGAGKGELTNELNRWFDRRGTQTYAYWQATEQENERPRLWPHWRDLPPKSTIAIMLGSWYTQPIVERAMDNIDRHEFEHELIQFEEINDFESQLVENKALILKFWLHISPEDQLRRFEERKQTPWKQHKITDEDWRNREKWNEYEAAVNEMLIRTDTETAPWVVVSANSKHYARVRVAETFCERLESVLE
jgi:polyphosphate kinase 2 (PPK2 family)